MKRLRSTSSDCLQVVNHQAVHQCQALKDTASELTERLWRGLARRNAVIGNPLSHAPWRDKSRIVYVDDRPKGHRFFRCGNQLAVGSFGSLARPFTPAFFEQPHSANVLE